MLFVRGLHNLNRFMVYGSILTSFTWFFFRIHCPFKSTRYNLFSLLDGATMFAKLRSKIAISPKIGGKVCAYHFVPLQYFRVENIQGGPEKTAQTLIRNNFSTSGHRVTRFPVKCSETNW